MLASLALADDSTKEKKAAPPIAVPFELLKTQHMVVNVKINGKGPYRLIFDTGAPVTLINNKGDVLVDNPARLPPIGEIESIAEPWVRVDVVTPTSYIGPLMELATGRRGTFENMEYLDPERVLIHFELPLAEVAEQVLAISAGGLQRRARLNKSGKDESVHLERIGALVEKGWSPADALVDGLTEGKPGLREEMLARARI